MEVGRSWPNTAVRSHPERIRALTSPLQFWGMSFTAHSSAQFGSQGQSSVVDSTKTPDPAHKAAVPCITQHIPQVQLSTHGTRRQDGESTNQPPQQEPPFVRRRVSMRDIGMIQTPDCDAARSIITSTHDQKHDRSPRQTVTYPAERFRLLNTSIYKSLHKAIWQITSDHKTKTLDYM